MRSRLLRVFVAMLRLAVLDAWYGVVHACDALIRRVTNPPYPPCDRATDSQRGAGAAGELMQLTAPIGYCCASLWCPGHVGSPWPDTVRSIAGGQPCAPTERRNDCAQSNSRSSRQLAVFST